MPPAVGRDRLAQILGGLARRTLRQPGFEGTVLASLRQAVYFCDSGGQLLWLALPSHPPHRRAILAEFDPSLAAVGSSVRMSGGCLIVDGLPGIAILDATCWSPPPIGRAHLLDWDALANRLPGFAAEVAQASDRRGFGHLIGRPPGNLPEVDSNDPDLRRWEAIFPPARDLLWAGETEGLAGVWNAAPGLIGLGPGLTPAGDDFVGGLLFAFEHVGRANPGRVDRDHARRRAFLEHVRTATNQISYTILCDLSHGHGPEPMHSLLQSLLDGEEPGRALTAARAITKIGHTSGWDLLAGMLSGLALLVGRGGR